jgi:hypothetical protein
MPTENTPTTLDEAKRQISNAVYAATSLVERLEHAGLLHGNGHHIRQELAAHAATVVAERWTEDVKASCTSTPDNG